jgi:hypothetical protein
VPKTLRTSAKKFSLPNRRTLQNQLIRTNHSRRARLVSTSVENLSATLRPPCLCALCVEFPFPASLFIASFAPETRLVAQGAAPVAGPEAFSCRIIPHDLWRMPEAAKPRIICTCAKRLRNSRRISTSISKGLKHDWNQHLQKTRRGGQGFYVAGVPYQRPLARHSAPLMWGCGRLHSGAEHRSLREIRITAK